MQSTATSVHIFGVSAEFEDSRDFDLQTPNLCHISLAAGSFFIVRTHFPLFSTHLSLIYIVSS